MYETKGTQESDFYLIRASFLACGGGGGLEAGEHASAHGLAWWGGRGGSRCHASASRSFSHVEKRKIDFPTLF